MQNIWTPESFAEDPYASRYFQNIVRWACQHHGFYRKHIENPAQFVPLLDRATAYENNLALLNGHEPDTQTSGSTGFPLDIAWSPKKTEFNAQVHQQLQQIMGGPLNRVVIDTRYFDNDPRPEGFAAFAPLPDQIAFIEKRRREDNIEAIVTYSTNALHLAQYILREGLNMDFIRRIVCFAETFDEHMRELVQEAFPAARIFSTYSCKEVGLIAFQCPHDHHYHHTHTQTLGIEILDDDDKPCGVGEAGRVVLTDFVNTHSAFIRYDIADLVIPGECPCGQFEGLAFSSVLGKVRGALKKENGELLSYTRIEVPLRKIPGMRQSQLIQEELDLIRVRYVLGPESSDAEAQLAIKDILYEFIGSRLRLQFEPEKEIRREDSGKFHQTICKV
jgi:phenylacetate-coenzyme A ligase PaaK-like adenylate-forming protein